MDIDKGRNYRARVPLRMSRQLPRIVHFCNRKCLTNWTHQIRSESVPPVQRSETMSEQDLAVEPENNPNLDQMPSLEGEEEKKKRVINGRSRLNCLNLGNGILKYNVLRKV